VTAQQARRAGYLEEFVKFWSDRPETERIWISFYTPQIGEQSPESLDAHDRDRLLADMIHFCSAYPKLRMSRELVEAFADPPKSPSECLFAQVTTSISANLETRITPCQFGGQPDCARCGCLASAGLTAIARHRLLGVIPVGAIFSGSVRLGQSVGRSLSA
jgi:hypothetical protein